MFQVAAFPQSDGGDSGIGGLLGSAGKLVGENKGSITSFLGMEEGKEGDYLTTMLDGLKVDPAIITNMTTSFSGKEGFSSLMDAFKNTDKLEGLLAEQTNMDPEDIKGFVDTIKNKFK